MTTYTVNYLDPKTEAEIPIGQIGYGEQGQLTFVSALPSQEEYLRELAERINQLPHLTERTEPAADAPRYTLTTRMVPRYSPEFRSVLKSYLRRLYQLSLTTTEEEEPTEPRTFTKSPAEKPLAIPQRPVASKSPRDTAGQEPGIELSNPEAAAKEPATSPQLLLLEAADEEPEVEVEEEPEEEELLEPPEPESEPLPEDRDRPRP